MKTQTRQKQGSTLIVTLGLILILFVLASTAFDFTMFAGRSAERINARQRTMNVADSALEMLFAQFKDGFANYKGSLGNLCPDRTYFKTYLTGKTPTGAAFPELAVYFSDVGGYASSPLDQSSTRVFTTYAIEPLDSQGRVAASGTCDAIITNAADGMKEGKAYRFLATVDVMLPSVSGSNVTAHLSRVFEYRVQSFLNYAIFANDDLEIHPGPNMTITGPVHTNSRLWVGAGGGQVTFADSVDATGKIFNLRMTTANGGPANDPQHGDTATAATGVGWSNKQANSKSVTPLDVDSSKFSLADTNPNNDSYHEMIESPIYPLSANPDPLTPGDTRSSSALPFDYEHLDTLRMSNVADYIITIDNATHDVRQPATITIADSSGTTVPATSDVYKAFVNGNFTTTGGKTVTTKVLTTGESFIDVREGDSNGNTTMQVTSFDIDALKSAAAAGAINIGFSSGLGVVINDVRGTQAYVPAVTHNTYTYGTKNGKQVVTGTTVVIDAQAIPKAEPAVRLKKGYVLPDGGLTIVSQNPVYIQGDYNTGGSAANQPLSNSRTGTWPSASWKVNDPTSHDPTTVTNSSGLMTFVDPMTGNTAQYYWQPAAIVADAINVLSNNWNDANSGTSPTAKPTTVNAAFIAGNVSTTNSNYSGGVENFPRFLENWSNVRFSYMGSMILLYQSQQANQPWGKSGVYSAPTRCWGYDKLFMQYGVPLLSAGASGPGGMGGGGSRKTIAGGGAKMYFRKQWVSRNIQ